MKINVSVYDVQPVEKSRSGPRAVFIRADSSTLQLEIGAPDGKGLLVTMTKIEANILSDNIKTLAKDLMKG